MSCTTDVKVYGVTKCRGIKLNYGAAWNKVDTKYFGIGELLTTLSESLVSVGSKDLNWWMH